MFWIGLGLLFLLAAWAGPRLPQTVVLNPGGVGGLEGAMAVLSGNLKGSQATPK